MKISWRRFYLSIGTDEDDMGKFYSIYLWIKLWDGIDFDFGVSISHWKHGWLDQFLGRDLGRDTDA